MKLFLSILFSILVFTGFAASKVLAVDVPNFPQCQGYSGETVANYSSGVHGIVGLNGEYVGSDIVYTLQNGNLIQCFCSVSNSGIQTNWWKQGSLSSEQINTLKNLGWIFIPSGEPWGLENTPYFAKNINYSCGSVNPTPTHTPAGGGGDAPVCNSAKPQTPVLVSANQNGSSAVLVWTSVSNATHYTIAYGPNPNNQIYGVPNTGNVTTYTINALDPNTRYYFAVRAVNNCMPGDFSGGNNPVGQVLGLATTGSWMQIISVLSVALVAMTLALYVRKNSSK